MKKQRLEELFALYLRNGTSQEEERELMSLLTDTDLESEKERLLEEWMNKMPETHSLSTIQGDRIFDNIIGQKRVQAPVIKMGRRKIWWSVAAAVLILLAGASYFLLPISRNANPSGALSRNDRAPGRSQATLTLSNGSKILLDSAQVGLIAQQGNARITKLNNGELAYNALSEKPTEQINTLTTPIGGQYKLKLPDGTLVWLNAASSIQYPTAFSGKERSVKVTGEVYLEVAKNPAMPFIVKTSNSEVRVLGTHFNINDYPDEETQKITLLEGAVRVTDSITHLDLKPGQQAEIIFNLHIELRKAVDTDNIVSWKDGYFNFQQADIQTIMRQISKWYDLEVIYVSPISKKRFNGMIKRDQNLKEVLKIMEAGGIKFKLEGKKLYISS